MARYKNGASVAAAAVVVGPIKLDAQHRSSIAIQTGHTNDAAAAVVLEGSWDDGTTFVTLAAIDPADAATVKTSFTGIDKCGVVPLNGSACTHVQVRRTDGAGGVCFVSLCITAS